MPNIRVTLWREYTDAAREIPGMLLGDADAEEGAAAASALRFSEQGARKVDLTDANVESHYRDGVTPWR